MVQSVTVRVPATTANMGPGFDCVGMALDIWNSVHVEVGKSGFVIHGEGKDGLPAGPSNVVYRYFCLPFEESGRDVPKVTLTCENEVPIGRGLGSSSAALVAGLLAGNELAGCHFTRDEILQIAAKEEGHPDNVAPALLGGCQIGVWEGSQIVTAAVPTPDDLRAVLFLPDVWMYTEKARSILPAQIARKDAVYNIGRMGLLVKALVTGDFTDLAVATQDRLHQPARQTIFPAMQNIFRAALGAGALGVFLSGAGSGVLALTRDNEMTIGYEMADAAAKSGVHGTVKVTRPTNQGAEVVVDE